MNIWTFFNYFKDLGHIQLQCFSASFKAVFIDKDVIVYQLMFFSPAATVY